MSTNRNIIVCGELVTVGCPIVLWTDSPNYSFYKTGKFNHHNDNLEQLQSRLKTFVLHHSVTYSAKETYNGLIGRGLSVNFILDDDINEEGFATIYQCLDVKDGGWSHKPLNDSGPGIEICYHPEYWTNSNLYSREKIKNNNIQPHDVIEDTIHGVTRKVFAPTSAQVASLTCLLAAFGHTFSNIKAQFPRNTDGTFLKTTLKHPEEYVGLMNHYNITKEKIDAMGLDLEVLEKDVTNLVSIKS